MKKILMLFALLLCGLFSIAQDEILPVDESGNYAFYEVVELSNFDSVTLLNNAEDFLRYYVNKKYKKEIVTDKQEGKVTARSSFLVFKKGSLGKNVDGSIEYTIQIDVKNNRYRYILTDFIFQEYQRNRYGKFEPAKGKIKRLDEPVSDLNKWQWDDHKRTVKDKMEILIGELKVQMLKTAEKKPKR